MPDMALKFLDKYKTHLLLVILTGVLTLVGIKSVPGAVFTTAYQVNQISEHMHARDSLVDAFHVSWTARLDSTNRRVDLDSELLRAMARKECAELGRQKAESYGFPCHETVFHLPNR